MIILATLLGVVMVPVFILWFGMAAYDFYLETRFGVGRRGEAARHLAIQRLEGKRRGEG